MTIFKEAYDLGYRENGAGLRALMQRYEVRCHPLLKKAYEKGRAIMNQHAKEAAHLAQCCESLSQSEMQGWVSVEDRMPPDCEFVLALCPSGYTTIDNVVVTARRDSEYRGDTWINHANDPLLDGGLRPTHWRPMGDLK